MDKVFQKFLRSGIDLSPVGTMPGIHKCRQMICPLRLLYFIKYLLNFFSAVKNTKYLYLFF